MVEKDCEFAAACVIDEGGSEGDKEVKEQTYGCGLLSSLECGRAECAAGDHLQETLEGDALGSDQG